MLLIVTALLAGCRSAENAVETPAISTPTQSAVPTLIPTQTATRVPEPEELTADAEQPDRFRAEILPELMSVFPLTGSPDYAVQIEVFVLSGDLDPYIRIYSSMGDQMAFADTGGGGDPEIITAFQFPSAGYYELAIGANWGAGTVGVVIARLPAVSISEDGILSFTNQDLYGTLEEGGSFHVLELTVERGRRFDLWAEARSPGLDLQFELYSPDSMLLAAQDDNVGLDPYLWNFMPAESGTYSIILSSYDNSTGSYAVHLRPSDGGEPLVLGEPAQVELQGSPRRSTWFTVDGAAFDGLAITVRPLNSRLDAVVMVTDPYGNPLSSSDLYGPGQPEALSLVQFPYDGTYQVELSTLGEGGATEYEAEIIPFSAIEQGGVIIPGDAPRPGRLPGGGAVAAYRIELNGAPVIAVDAHAVAGTATPDLVMAVYSEDGGWLVGTDQRAGHNPVLEAIPTASEDWVILLVWNRGPAAGDYEVVVTAGS
jgi:hypothetical protein